MEASNAKAQKQNRLRLTQTKVDELNEKKGSRGTGDLDVKSGKNRISILGSIALAMASKEPQIPGSLTNMRAITAWRPL
ncbi:hypothetical protein SLS55_008941 [Diplodia seriata]|uniref:Uncharacterized protein n=1 Tax=Diplodia seriata TaxID=420778 RepID=A0ABR3C8B2_9PEZI